MLSVTGLNHFYYVRDFTDMRCKHSRALSIIRERLHQEPYDGDVFIVYANDAGTEMAATYHSVIGTVKLHGSSIWNFIGFFSKTFLTGAGIMLTCFLEKSLWLPVNVKFKTN